MMAYRPMDRGSAAMACILSLSPSPLRARGTVPGVADAASVTELLVRARAGDHDALQRAVALLYQELRRIAARQMRREQRGHTLQPTALVNEALLRLLPGHDIHNRLHFLALAATTMRRVLVDYARQRLSHKRGRGAEVLALDDAMPVGTGPRPVDVLDVDAALLELEASNPRAARIVELRFFGGYTDKEVAEIVGLSVPTVRRDWDTARSWLQHRLRPSTTPPV